MKRVDFPAGAGAHTEQRQVPRQWLAQLDLRFARRGQKTLMTHAAHSGPLRVQRPFYPELDGSCQVYLLHPPGGLVIGDALAINAQLEEQAAVLLTTPSAGKIYGTKGARQNQRQTVNLSVADGACLEWLPQETIVFNGANGELKTRIDVHGDAGIFAWDIVRLGRVASGERFASGRCGQSIELLKNGRPHFVERNQFVGGSALLDAPWGLRGASTVATLLASIQAPRALIDQWLADLNAMAPAEGSNLWGLTQKGELFIARFLGDSIIHCRQGLEYLWRQGRPLLNGKQAVVPRIWHT